MGNANIIALLEQQLQSNARTIESLQQTIRDLKDTIASLERLLKERDESLSRAASQMRGMKSTYLPKKSEKVGGKPTVTGEQKEANKQASEAERKARGNNGAKRKDYFTVETIVEDIYPEGLDPTLCTLIGIREVIRYEMLRPSFIKHIYKIHILKKDGVAYSGKTPLSPLLNSRFDGSFIAGIAELRYLYSMPVERIVKYFNGNGFDLDRQTAYGLLSKIGDLLENLHKALQSAVKEGRYLNCDETYHTVLIKADDNDGRTSKKGYIWVIANAETGLVYFFYDDGSRSERVILNELKGYKGVIQSDGLGAYKKVSQQSNGDIVRLACLQHCKRDFMDDSLKNNPDAQEVINLANQIYHYDHMHKIGIDGWTSDDNLKWRQEYAPPILDALKSKLEDIKGNLNKYPPKSLMNKAAKYFLNEWDGIEAISNYGYVTWDNNRLERINRYVSLSRHNSLFFGSHEGAKRGCIFYSLACSCRELGINFFDYLSDILNKTAALPPGTSMEEYRKLLPDQWKKEQQG